MRCVPKVFDLSGWHSYQRDVFVRAQRVFVYSAFFAYVGFCLLLKMTEKCEQPISIKFCFKLEKSCAETIEMIQKVFGDECMGKTQIKK